jgi:hypothetical protein
MKTYVMTTGVIFGLLALVHVWRVSVEGWHAANPFFIVITIVAGAFALWAWRLARRSTNA